MRSGRFGLRNPFRAYYDAPTGRLFIGDVGGNDDSTAMEEVNLGAAGANYGWPNIEGTSTAPLHQPALLLSAQRARCRHHRRLRLSRKRSSQRPIRAATSSPTTPRTGSAPDLRRQRQCQRRLQLRAGRRLGRRPVRRHRLLTEGPDGALYYVDLGYSDIGGTFGVSKIRRIRFSSRTGRRSRSASANPTAGPAPLTVDFSSAGSSDPEDQPLTYAWTFGDGATSTVANPSHTYAQAGQYTARLTVSDGVNTTLSTPLTISVGNRRPRRSCRRTDGATFQAGDVISFSGTRPTRRTARCRPARIPGTSTSCTRATYIRGRRSTGVNSGTSRSRRRVTTSAATRATGSR